MNEQEEVRILKILQRYGVKILPERIADFIKEIKDI